MDTTVMDKSLDRELTVVVVSIVADGIVELLQRIYISPQQFSASSCELKGSLACQSQQRT